MARHSAKTAQDGAGDSKTLIYFEKKGDLRMLPPPEGKTPYAHYKHKTQPGFYVRVSKPNKDDEVSRIYFYRWENTGPDGKRITHWDKIGPAFPLKKGGPVVKYEDAQRIVLERRSALLEEQVGPVSTRLTVGGAWAYAVAERYSKSDSTKGKEKGLYKTYFQHLENRYLDELNRGFWVEFMTQLREGTLVVGEAPRKDGRGMAPIVVGPLANASLLGVMHLASVLYETGNKHGGLSGALKGSNNPGDLRKSIGAPNEKDSHIPLNLLGAAWRASDQLISPWWRDMFRVFVLTGLRRSLLFSMRFDEIDFENGLYVIDPRKPGAKRKADKITPSTKNIRLPLSGFVLDIIRRRREFAEDKDGLVWFTPKPTRGKRTKKERQALSDPRSAWTLLEWSIGNLHFTPHDLRRTFGTAGQMGSKDVFAVSLLLLHSPTQVAKAVGIPGITMKYLDTDEAVERLREAANSITAYVLELAAMSAEEAKSIVEPPLPPILDEAIDETTDLMLEEALAEAA
jgi:integrase